MFSKNRIAPDLSDALAVTADCAAIVALRIRKDFVVEMINFLSPQSHSFPPK